MAENGEEESVIMSYISFDADKEAKIKKEDIKGYANHVFRQTLGKNTKHKNDMIDPDKTYLNQEYMVHGKTLVERYEERLEDYNGKRKIRSDAVRMRGLILQPSSDVFDGKTDEEKQEIMDKFVRDVFPWLEANFHVDNVMGMATHHDESNPHLHVAIMPMTPDGRLSQKDFFKGPRSMASMHRTLREHMNNAGWDFEVENKYEGAKGYETKEYKANAGQIEADRVKRGEFEKRERSLDEREGALDERELRISGKQRELDTREDELEQREDELDQREDDLVGQEVALRQRFDEWYKVQQGKLKKNMSLVKKRYADLNRGYRRVIDVVDSQPIARSVKDNIQHALVDETMEQIEKEEKYSGSLDTTQINEDDLEL